jgi:hypothetical protein
MKNINHFKSLAERREDRQDAIITSICGVLLFVVLVSEFMYFY